MKIISDLSMRTIIVGIVEHDFILEEDVENEYEIVIDEFMDKTGKRLNLTKVRQRIHKDGAIYFYDVSEYKRDIVIKQLFNILFPEAQI